MYLHDQSNGYECDYEGAPLLVYPKEASHHHTVSIFRCVISRGVPSNSSDSSFSKKWKYCSDVKNILQTQTARKLVSQEYHTFTEKSVLKMPGCRDESHVLEITSLVKVASSLNTVRAQNCGMS